MGFLGDLIDDAFELPGKVIRGASDMTAEVLAETLCLPLRVVEAAVEAGCRTEAEIKRFADKMGI